MLYSTAIIAFSLLAYCLEKGGLITGTTWTTEYYGCVWGAMLATAHEELYRRADRRWVPSAAGLCLLSLLLGISYLRLKKVLFFGDYLLKIVLGIAILSFILIVSMRVQYGNKAAYFLGSISFEIYLIHGPLFHLLEEFAAGRGIPFTSGSFLLTAFTVTILLSTAVHFLLQKCMDTLQKRSQQ